MIALLVAALLDLRLAASIEGLRVRATLHNDGAQAVDVVVRDACAGPLLTLVVDGVARPFATTGKRCTVRQPQKMTLPPGGELSMLSNSLDGRRHYLVVRWQELASAPIVIPTAVRVDVTLSAAAHARAGEPIALEIAHVNRSPEDIVVQSCGEDRLLLDGKESPLEMPCAAGERTLGRNGAFLTRARLTLPAGRHLLRARWHDVQSADVTIDVE
jgi:hypothetical protein